MNLSVLASWLRGPAGLVLSAGLLTVRLAAQVQLVNPEAVQPSNEALAAAAILKAAALPRC